MIVKEIMTKNVEFIESDKMIADAARIMKEQNIGTLPVIDNQKLVGFITDRDITIRCVAENRDFQSTSVRDCMTKNLISVYEDETVEKASQIMCDNKVRRLVVVDRHQQPVGMVNLKHIGTFTHDSELINKTMDDFFEESQTQH